LLKERRSSREIARLVSVAPETVQAVAQLHADELDKHFSGVGQTIGRIICGFADRLERNMDSVPVAQTPHAMKVRAELRALLEGQATARLERVIQPVQVSNSEQYLQKSEGF
jgi:hypothetical protein